MLPQANGESILPPYPPSRRRFLAPNAATRHVVSIRIRVWYRMPSAPKKRNSYETLPLDGMHEAEICLCA